MSIQSKLYSFFKIVFPSTYIEFGVFLFFLCVYGILGSYIAVNYTVIFDNRIPWDAYFSFDNRSIVMTGGSFERHPLSYYFFNWLREFAFLFSDGKKNDVFRLVLAWASNLMVSLSIVQIFKYLKNIIKLPLLISLLLVVFFSLFSTAILLSFTPENFTYTLFLLMLFNYYAAVRLEKDKKISTLALVAGGITIGGLTITNLVKVFIPVFFEKNLFKNWKNLMNAFLRGLVTVVCFVLLYLNRIEFKYQNIFSKTSSQYEKFSNAEPASIWDMIVSFFFGGNMLFSSFIIRDKHNMKGFHYKGLFMDVYSSPMLYLFVFVVMGLLVWSYCKNFKNKFVQIITISLVLDIVIHCFMRFGLHTSYIYGGHFVFVYVLLLGWLFYAYKSSPKMLSFLSTIVGVLLMYLGYNNYLRMEEFFDFLNKFYQ
ncbi:DUF6080 domain-containing protein [Chryseobacterium gwangjuense]|uniref:DUF6080 domain-containing protein n=1 Tax=Chryseobacterium gwangjuense TaxID=1069980 RepID=UPI001E5633B8|nr:DUF6080 domain-containing protein [Chryseobacterium gwangjuense]MCE3075281.1 DUF6080 domain-containing protein [Chryseobacterium gwangjuense]